MRSSYSSLAQMATRFTLSQIKPGLNPGRDVFLSFFRTGHCKIDILFFLCVWSQSIKKYCIEPCGHGLSTNVMSSLFMIKGNLQKVPKLGQIELHAKKLSDFDWHNRRTSGLPTTQHFLKNFCYILNSLGKEKQKNEPKKNGEKKRRKWKVKLNFCFVRMSKTKSQYTCPRKESK